ncbi:sigma-70 family RNA polymerase sigma factor [Acidovorax sp. NCPPB 2350]|nr:sigma-70 family RNA polymerase sigma factor [Acidovorax sp. NCPPB 2350]
MLKESCSGLEKEFLLNQAKLRGIARGILHSRELAEEIVQDAYVKIMELSPRAAIVNAACYCCQIVRNLALDCYRRRSMEQAYRASLEDPEDLDAFGLQFGETPERLAQVFQIIEILDAELKQLPARTQQAFKLSRSKGLTQRQIAQELGCSATLVNFMLRDVELVLERHRHLLE